MKRPEDEEKLVTTFSRNVRQLCRNAHLPAVKLAAHAGISQGIAYRLLNPRTTKDNNPTLDTMYRISAVFQLPLWMLLMPDLPLRMLLDRRMEGLVDRYIAASQEARATLDMITRAPHSLE